MTPTRRPHAVIAGGGTAGHVQPALAIAQALVRRGHEPDAIHFVGSQRGLETRLVPEAGFPFTALPGRGIERRLSLRAVGAALSLLVGIVKGIVLVARLLPDVVVSVGGYASVPAVIGAALTRRPVVIAEQNSVPGAANRMAARVAAASAVTYPGTALPGAVVTGNPVVEGVLEVDRATDRVEARTALGLPLDRFVVLVFGGSLGARRINEATIDAVQALATRDDLAIRHVVGRRDWDDVSSRLPEPPGDGIVYQAVDYEDRMPLAYAAADVAVTRAGASTASELAVVGLPAVLVPFPGATGDHQRHNASALVEAGGARMVLDADLDGDVLVEIIDELASDLELLERMGGAMASMGIRDAADRVADLVERHARGGAL